MNKVENIAFEQGKQPNQPRFPEKGKIARKKEERATDDFRAVFVEVNKEKNIWK